MERLPFSHRLKEGFFILLCSLGLYLFIALLTYHSADPAWSHAVAAKKVHNAAGQAGAWLADLLFCLFGYVAYWVPTLCVWAAFGIYCAWPQQEAVSMRGLKSLGGLFTLIASCGLVALHAKGEKLPMQAGGIVGDLVARGMVSHFNHLGTHVILGALGLSGITFLSGFSCTRAFLWLTQKGCDQYMWGRKKVGRWGSRMFLKGLSRFMRTRAKPQKPEAPLLHEESLLGGEAPQARPFLLERSPMKKKSFLRKQRSQSLLPSRQEKPLKQEKKRNVDHRDLPPLSLLEAAEDRGSLGFSMADKQALSQLVEARLLEFGVSSKVVGVYPGPVITRFELELAAGIKVSKMAGLAKDLARSLSVVRVRVVEVIPGKSVVGLEVPNSRRERVRLKELLESDAYGGACSPLSLALGKDIAGKPVVVDLSKMPHLLVSGTTGSGKSVGLNAMLLSILYKAIPEEVRLILIDPKMLELSVYDDIPHLLTPVVTDMKEAANALRWCVAEMERRYQRMAALGVRNLAGYNHRITQAEKQGKPLRDPLFPTVEGKYLEVLPMIVVVIDEFADMMMVVGKKVEELIARIAQKARAAGIHLLLATQRPSVDVITGLIKANIPTRIAFQVSSRIDSRTILDQTGAEQLLGYGDMLYLPPGAGIPLRVHGAFVSDEEVHRVVEVLREKGKPDYQEEVLGASPLPLEELAEGEENDALYDKAVFVILETRKAAASLLQRRLKIGYPRAARLIEQMEAQGLVSALLPNGTREILVPEGERK